MLNTMGNPSMGAINPMGGMPRMTPPRPISQPLRTQYVPGRFVSSESDITPGEIPMDNSISFFCLNDLSKIIIKQWNGQGLLDTATYVLEVQKPLPDQVQQQTQQQTQQQAQETPPAPEQEPQPDMMQEFQKSMMFLSQSIENAFNNLGANMQQSLKAINDRLDAATQNTGAKADEGRG